MILKDSEALARLNSPMNLFNRMNRSDNSNGNKSNGLSLFIPATTKAREVKPEQFSQPSGNFINPFEKKSTATIEPTTKLEENNDEVTVEDLLGEDINYDIKLQQAHDQAVNVLGSALSHLSIKLPDLGAAKLADVARKASQIVDTIRKEKLERAKINSGKEVHFHFYQPEQKKLSDYQVIEVG